jgi:hypothetical protein
LLASFRHGLSNLHVPEVFLSYRQIDDAQRERALTFAKRLTGCGIPVILDQLFLDTNPGGPPEGWPKWSSDRAIQTPKVVILGSKEWFECFDDTQKHGTGLGAACEAGDLRQRIYNAGGVNEDIRIVLFDDADSAHIPTHIERYHRFQADRDFDSIVKWLGGTPPGAAPHPVGPDWPNVAPPLAWPVADHSQARSAFEQLIVRSAPFRYLPIAGHSETGKSHLTKQFLANALSIPDLVCGRFDFKGSSDMDAELRNFAQHLDVADPPPNTDVSSQLGQIYAQLKKAARPTLLIFDTFEFAGDAERWVKENLLLALVRAPWLRVIVVGQRVPQPHGEPWAAFSSPVIQLREPTVEEWLEYGIPHKPSIDLDFVRRAHECCSGKSTILAQLLGPAA